MLTYSRFVAILGYLWFGLCPAMAFDNYEHKAVGDISLRLAKHIFLSDNKNCTNNERLCEKLKDIDRYPDAGSLSTQPILSYGDIVQCVDNFMTPEKMMVWIKQNAIEQDAAKEPALAFPDLFKIKKPSQDYDKQRNLCRIDEDALGSALRGMQATHNNHTHFQEELLNSIATYHTLAMSLARNNSDIGAALLVNAIADHYLHDFFAPGHVVTPRSSLTDTVSVAMHDFHNEHGGIFYISDRASRDGGVRYNVLDTLKKIGYVVEQNPISCPRVAEKSNGIDVDRLIYELMHSPMDRITANASVKRSCDDAAVGGDRSRAADLAAVNKAVQDLPQQSSGKIKPLRMIGDGALWKGGGENSEPDYRLDQRLLMIAANTTSILEVLDARAVGPERSAFTKYRWKYDWSTTKEDKVYAEMSFGFYSIAAGDKDYLPNMGKKSSDGSSEITEVDDVKHLAADRQQGGQADKAAEQVGNSRKDFFYDNIFRVSADREEVYRGNNSGAWVYGFEWQPGWISPRELLGHKLNIGVGLGVARKQEQDVHSSGVTGRLIFTFPETEFSVGLWARELFHGGNAEHGWRTGYGISVEQGFSSMFSFYLGVGRDYGAVAGGRLDHETVLFGGMSMTFPDGRIPGRHKY